jgi:hypothetical protein
MTLNVPERSVKLKSKFICRWFLFFSAVIWGMWSVGGDVRATASEDRE